MAPFLHFISTMATIAFWGGKLDAGMQAKGDLFATSRYRLSFAEQDIEDIDSSDLFAFSRTSPSLRRTLPDAAPPSEVPIPIATPSLTPTEESVSPRAPRAFRRGADTRPESRSTLAILGGVAFVIGLVAFVMMALTKPEAPRARSVIAELPGVSTAMPAPAAEELPTAPTQLVSSEAPMVEPKPPKALAAKPRGKSTRPAPIGLLPRNPYDKR